MPALPLVQDRLLQKCGSPDEPAGGLSRCGRRLEMLQQAVNHGPLTPRWHLVARRINARDGWLKGQDFSQCQLARAGQRLPLYNDTCGINLRTAPRHLDTADYYL
jgi:hypothetical protein